MIQSKEREFKANNFFNSNYTWIFLVGVMGKCIKISSKMKENVKLQVVE